MVWEVTGTGVPDRISEGCAMQENTAATWSVGEVVYLAWLAVLALAWVVLPMALVLAGR